MNDDLIRLAVFAVGVISIGFLVLVAWCIIKCQDSCTGDNHNYGSSQEHATTIQNYALNYGTGQAHATITIREELPGLHPSILQSISIVEFNSQDFEDAIECVVCLSELEDGDNSRVLPSCNHWFHSHCIESWFQSHSTCPVCREIVRLVQ